MEHSVIIYKVTACIESAKTVEHHKSISRMISNLENYAKHNDEALLDVLGYLKRFNTEYQEWKEHNLKKNKFGRLKFLFYICITNQITIKSWVTQQISADVSKQTNRFRTKCSTI
jgi:hypothetical protein